MNRHWPLLAAAAVNVLATAYNLQLVLSATNVFEVAAGCGLVAITVGTALFMLATFRRRTLVSHRRRPWRAWSLR